MDLSNLSSAGSGPGTNPFGDPSSAGPSVPLHLILSLNIALAKPITLELQPPNYTTWSSFLHALLMSYNIQDHVNGTVDARNWLTDAVWTQINWCIIRWLLRSTSAQVRGALNPRDPTD